MFINWGVYIKPEPYGAVVAAASALLLVLVLCLLLLLWLDCLLAGWRYCGDCSRELDAPSYQEVV